LRFLQCSKVFINNRF